VPRSCDHPIRSSNPLNSHLASPQQLHTLHPSTSCTMASIDPALASELADTDVEHQLPPVSQAVQQAPPAMQTLQPHHPDQYRALPAPQQMYAQPYPQPPMGAYGPQQPAPRQRTAIACRYCRRRKVSDTDCVPACRMALTFAPRFAVQASTNLRMAAAPTVSASPKNVFSRQ